MAVDSISFEGDEIEARKHVKMARKCMDALRAKLGNSGAVTASTQMRVSDHAYVIALVGPGIAKAVIVAGYTAQPVDDSYRRSISDVPDFLSGVAIRSRIVTDDAGVRSMEQFWPTAACALAFALPTAPSNVARLAVEPDSALEGQWKEPSTGLVPAQTLRVVPTMYTGRMRQVVQFLLGFGIEPDRSRYDRVPPLLARYGADAERQVVPLYERQVAQAGRRVLYDWSFARTHGITVAADNALWLIEISVQRGVQAMPLPLNELTQDPRFREKLVAIGDDAGITALELFGAWPTGETFPTGDALTQARRAGLVIELLAPDELDPMYDNYTAYSTAMGWSFDARGREAHATAWRYADDRIQRGAWFSVRITIGATVAVDEPPEAISVMRRIQRQAVGEDERRWLHAKARRMSRSQCQAVLQESSAAASLETLRAIELEPAAPASATFVRVQEGPLYWPGKYQPWIQFPEPRLGYCVSHQMRQQFGPAIANPPRCDTVVHVLHQGEQLRTVRFLYDPRPAVAPDIDTFEECTYEGEWETIATSGTTTVQPTMVTSDVDDRTEAAPAEQRTSLRSTAIGYTSVTLVDDIAYPPHGNMARMRSFIQRYRTSTKNDPSVAGVIRVPFFDRSAYYYAFGRFYGTDIAIEGWNYTQLPDPTSYSTWRNFPGYTAYSGNVPISEHPAGCGAVSTRTVWAEHRAQFACMDNADQGPWASVCDNADSLAYQSQLPPLPQTVVTDRSGVGLLRVQLFNDSQQSPIAVVTEPAIDTHTWAFQQWFATSPDPETFEKQYIAATCNTLGDRIQTVYSADPNGETRIAGAPMHDAMLNAQCTYVGVVDG